MNVQVQPRVTTTQRRLPFECVALVLQGGGALGAYQAGVYEALALTMSPRWRLSPQPDPESAADNSADPLPCCPWRMDSPEIARTAAPPLCACFAIRPDGCMLSPHVTPFGRSEMSTMRVMAAAALAAVFAVSTAW